MPHALIDIREQLVRQWSDDPSGQLSITLYDHLCKAPTNQLNMLTFLAISQILGRDNLDAEIVKAVTILINSRFHPLEKRLLLIDDEDQEFELDRSTAIEFARTGFLAHPDSGEEIENARAMVKPFFCLTEEFAKLKDAAAT